MKFKSLESEFTSSAFFKSATASDGMANALLWGADVNAVCVFLVLALGFLVLSFDPAPSALMFGI